MARNGVVATSQPLASAAGLRVLQQGGNAVDAAVTAAAVLAVVEPTMNGVGGDLFAIVYDPKAKQARGLNASGRAPAAATPAEFKRRNLTDIPYRGVLSVSVPGVVDGWNELLAKHGTITLARALEPAIGYARDGFAVSEIIAGQWQAEEALLAKDPAAAATFLPGGKAPAAGDVFRNPRLASTLEQIAKGGRDAFYRGAIAKAIAADMTARGGLLTAADLAAHTSDWVTPLSTSYRGHDVLELPPNTQGIVALEMLNILEGFDVKALGHNSAAYLHLLVEAKKIAFADRAAWLGDLNSVPRGALDRMLSKDYAAARRKEIDPGRTADYKPLTLTPAAHAGKEPPAARGDTIYLTVADAQGNVVSLIQSIYENFGAAIAAGETGIALHNRGSLFSLEPGPPERARARQASVPHARAGDGAEGRQAVAVVRRHGRRHAAAGTRPGAAQPDRLRHERAGGGRSGAVPALGRRARARVGNLSRGAGRARVARPQDHLDDRRLRRLSGHPDRSADRRADGRIRSAQGRAGGRLLRSVAETTAYRWMRRPVRSSIAGSTVRIAESSMRRMTGSPPVSRITQLRSPRRNPIRPRSARLSTSLPLASRHFGCFERA